MKQNNREDFNVIPYLILMGIMILLVSSVRIVYTEGASMEPTFKTGNALLVVRDDSVEPVDIILVKHLDKWIIKRVYAVAGETVPMPFNDLPYWEDDAAPVIPKGYIFLVGDNRINSFDSRNPAFGLVPTYAVWGKVVLYFDGHSLLRPT